MLKKINRGLKRKDFEVSRKEGRVYQSPLFGVSVVKSSPSAVADDPSLTRRVEPVQIGFIISKKISKKAVERNKIRRRLGEIIKNKLPVGHKIVILAKKNILEANMDDLKKSWDIVYEKINSKNLSVL